MAKEVRYQIKQDKEGSVRKAVSIFREGNDLALQLDGRSVRVDSATYDEEAGSLDLVLEGVVHHYHVISLEGSSLVLRDSERVLNLTVNSQLEQVIADMGWKDSGLSGVGDLRSPMPGKVLDVLCQEGQQVEKGMPLVVLEAMKMENVLKAEMDGLVKNISVSSGDAVEKGQVLVEVA